MKLLFDENLSHRLIAMLADLYPGSSHVRLEGLGGAADKKIWDFAILNNFAIVTKDGDDFYPMSVKWGWPPSVIWLNFGNCTTALVEDQLRVRVDKIKEFGADHDTAMLVIGRSPPVRP